VPKPSDQRHVWTSFAKAIGTELREGDSITGASGLVHPLQALCVDDKTKRLILFSNEPDPRVAALVQGDIQATMPDVNVLVARPTVYDLGEFVRSFYADAATAVLSLTQVKEFTNTLNKLPKAEQQEFLNSGNLSAGFAVAGRMIKAVEYVPMSALTHVSNLVQQAALINWKEVLQSIKEAYEEKQEKPVPGISLSKVYEFNSSTIDLAYGVCPIPLYQFTEKDWELFLEGRHIEDVQERLRALNIYQYFFPPADQLALGVAERGVTKRNEITEIVASAPTLGHPYGANELIPNIDTLKDIVEQLSENSFVSEVDHAVELTADGISSRTKIKATPRESAISKLVNRFKVTLRLSTKDIWPG
jgi:hypothetical protein